MATNMGFIDPTANKPDGIVKPAERPSSLEGKVVGLLDNTKEQADVILETIGEALCERYGAESVVMRRKEHYSKAATPEMISEMAGLVDVAVAGLGG
ncbi:MAG: hypothetical protein FI717_12145 [SAR202 cluster bacterium]|nr:hypothetical protein [Chloroflexota bacterium]MQF94736.1 hypothetical protein [SAR202 cluster bacterium]HAA94587.1 hypothetical protein [Dehalococcoidia bacterium]MQG35040.1 hypothetical protein [SAR202 cluster bacterium]HCL25307.1 hypothetical protein [Dehalococcoidia bacterium]|tara:strand:+ start:4012 stop:4302 length:291 start_codon:yes stop_codon:yes gene_type:complete